MNTRTRLTRSYSLLISRYTWVPKGLQGVFAGRASTGAPFPSPPPLNPLRRSSGIHAISKQQQLKNSIYTDTNTLRPSRNGRERKHNVVHHAELVFTAEG